MNSNVGPSKTGPAAAAARSEGSKGGAPASYPPTVAQGREGSKGGAAEGAAMAGPEDSACVTSSLKGSSVSGASAGASAAMTELTSTKDALDSITNPHHHHHDHALAHHYPAHGMGAGPAGDRKSVV